MSETSGDGEEGEVSPNRAASSDLGSGGRRMGPRSYFLAAAVVVGTAVPFRHGLLTGGVKKALGSQRPAAAAPPLAGSAGSAVPPGQAPQAPAPASGSDQAPGPAAASTSTPDPRVVRAMRRPVQVQAGAGSLWTELRSLGVRVTWPESGEPQWSLDERLFHRGLRRLSRRVEHLPRNARLVHTVSGFHARPARSGRMLDWTTARQQLLTALTQPAFRQSLESPPTEKPEPIALTIPVHEVKPTVTADHLGAINTLLATYSTSLGGSSRNRRHNIRVACEAIDGTVLMPGEVFSYNATVGPRTERAGFRTAPVIIHGELVPGTGGGVCQVSSTLYNIALLGDLKIVRRTHHHFPVHYVPAGRDATVAYGSLDLRFANSLPGPVALDVKSVGSRVMVRLYGTADCKREVQLVSRRVNGTRRRASAAGSGGKRVVVTRVVRLADGNVRREVVSRDSYALAPPSSHAMTSRRPRGHHRRSAGRERPQDHEAPGAAAKPMARAAPAPTAQ
jgi:vancomycin resistance protein YoaR